MAKRHLYWRLFRGLLANPATFTLSGGERRIPRPPRGWHARTCRNPARSIRSNSISGSSTPATCGAKCVHNGETGTYFAYGTTKLQQKLDLHVIERVVRELAPHGLRYVDLEGKPPFCTRRLLTSSRC